MYRLPAVVLCLSAVLSLGHVTSAQQKKGDLCAGPAETPCASGLTCFTPRDVCPPELHGTTICYGICDTETVVDMSAIEPGDDPVQVCQGYCEKLATHANIPGRDQSCEQSCISAGLLVIQGLASCSDICARAEQWPKECLAACARLEIIANITSSGESNQPPPCSSHDNDCDKCTAQQGCSFCYGSFIDSGGKRQSWSRCWDDDGSGETEALCEEDQGRLASEQGKCPDPDATPSPATTMDDDKCKQFDDDCQACLETVGCGFCSSSSPPSWSRCLPLDNTEVVASCQEEADFYADAEECPASDSCDDVTCNTPTCPSGTTLVVGPTPDGKCCPEFSCQQRGCSRFDSDCASCTGDESCNFCTGSFTGSDGKPRVWTRCFDADTAQDSCAEELGTLIDATTKCSSQGDCQGVTCDTDVSCDDGEVAVNFGTKDGECCPDVRCVQANDECVQDELAGASGQCSCTDDCARCNVAVLELHNGTSTVVDLGCTICDNNMYLQDGLCVSADQCKPGFAIAGENSKFRHCREPFACVDRETPDGLACRCPSGCINCEFGVGMDNYTCTSCENNRYHVAGRCPRQALCRKNGEIEDSMDGESCTCSLLSCRVCNIQKGKGVLNCETCENGKYNHNGECVDACPGDMVGIGDRAAGRYCTPPFDCFMGRIKSLDDSPHPQQGKDCRMPYAACARAAYRPDGMTCIRCRNEAFHHEEDCITECPDNLAHYGTGRYGRECREPFECRDKKSSIDGSYCSCRVPHCLSCKLEAGNVPGKKYCHECDWKTALLDNKCYKNCPSGYTKRTEDGISVCAPIQ